eukprot:m.7325 g.7325  ORF g.7325 m.7325 type:complete len:146 (-) comp4680_c0_seq1:42-479(-)
MGSKVVGKVAMYIKARSAAAAPPLGPALGQRGINIMQFCKDFNAKTQHIKQGVPIPTTILVKSDRTFTYTTRTPPTSYFLLQAAGLNRGSASPGKEIVGSVNLKQIFEIAKVKHQDDVFKTTSLEKVCRSIIGSARSMGIKVTRD